MVTRKERLQKQQEQKRETDVRSGDLKIQQEALREGKTVERVKAEKAVEKRNKEIIAARKERAKEIEKQLKDVSTISQAERFYESIPDEVKKYVKTTPKDIKNKIDKTIERLKKKVKEAEKSRKKWRENEREAETDWKEDRAEERQDRYRGQKKGYKEMINRLKEGQVIDYSEARRYARDVGDREEAEEEARNERQRAREKIEEERQEAIGEKYEELKDTGELEELRKAYGGESEAEIKERLRDVAELRQTFEEREDIKEKLVKDYGLRSDVAGRIAIEEREKFLGLEKGELDIEKSYKEFGKKLGYDVIQEDDLIKLEKPKVKKEVKKEDKVKRQETDLYYSGIPSFGDKVGGEFKSFIQAPLGEKFEKGFGYIEKFTELPVISQVIGAVSYPAEKIVEESQDIYESFREMGETEEGAKIGYEYFVPEGTMEDIGKIPEDEKKELGIDVSFDKVRADKRIEESLKDIEEGNLEELEIIKTPEEAIELKIERIEREIESEKEEARPNTIQAAGLISEKIELQKSLKAREISEKVQENVIQDISGKRENLKDKVREGKISQIEAEEQLEKYVDKRVGKGNRKLKKEVRAVSEGKEKDISKDIEISQEQLEQIREKEKSVAFWSSLPGVAVSGAAYAAAGAGIIGASSAIGGAVGGVKGAAIGSVAGTTVAYGEDVLDVLEIAPYTYEQIQEGDIKELGRIGTSVAVSLAAGTAVGYGVSKAKSSKIEAEIEQAPVVYDVKGKGIEAFEGIEVPKGLETDLKVLSDIGLDVRRVEADLVPRSTDQTLKIPQASADFIEVINRQGKIINRIETGKLEAEFRGRKQVIDILGTSKGRIEGGKSEFISTRLEGEMGDVYFKSSRELRKFQESNIEKVAETDGFEMFEAETETSPIFDIEAEGRVDIDLFSKRLSETLGEFDSDIGIDLDLARQQAEAPETRTESVFLREIEGLKAGASADIVKRGGVDILLPKEFMGARKFKTVGTGVTERIGFPVDTETGKVSKVSADLEFDTVDKFRKNILGDTELDVKQKTETTTEQAPLTDVTGSLKSLSRQISQPTGLDVVSRMRGSLVGEEQFKQRREVTDITTDLFSATDITTIASTDITTDITTETDQLERIETISDTTLDTDTVLDVDVTTDINTELETYLEQELELGEITETDIGMDINLPEIELELGLETPEKIKKGKPSARREKGYNVYAKSKGKYKRVNKYPLPKDKAKDMGSKVVDRTLSANFKIKPSSKKASKKTSISVNPFYWESTRHKFRGFKIKKGKRKRMDNKWIENKQYRLDTSSEVDQISVARFMKQERSKKKKQDKSKKRMNKIAGMDKMFSNSFGFGSNNKSKNNVDKIAGTTKMFKGKKNPFI